MMDNQLVNHEQKICSFGLLIYTEWIVNYKSE